MITTSRTMPESDFTPEDLTEDPTSATNREGNRDRSAAYQEPQPNSTGALLNSSELQTVLDMLAVMETAEELDQLQALTEAQKRQVWEATSEPIRQKLWRLRNQPHRDRSAHDATAGRSAETSEGEAQADIEDEYLEEDFAEAYAESESDREADPGDEIEEIEDLGQDLELNADSYPSAAAGLTEAGLPDVIQSSLTASPSLPFQPDRSTPSMTLQVGDRVVLKAQPRMSSAELKAVWQLQQIEGNNGEVYDAKLGVRIYPLSWMALYARAEPSNSGESLDSLNEGEEDF